MARKNILNNGIPIAISLNPTLEIENIKQQIPQEVIGELIKRNSASIGNDNSLRTAVELMARENIDMLPVVSKENNIVGILSYKDIISAYKKDIENIVKKRPMISLRRNGLKILMRGQKLIDAMRKK